MKFLILIHVLSAIIGVGPTFFSHVLLRRNQTTEELKASLALLKKLEVFPKVGGVLAVISGLILFFVGNYGSFLQIWLIGSLILYICIQVIVIGFAAPTVQKLSEFLDAHSDEYLKAHLKANRLFWLASALGTTLFVLMIIKPS